MEPSMGPYQFVNTRLAGNAKRIHAEMWERYKEEIVDLYLGKKTPLKHVMAILEHRGFKATKRQYVHQLSKWNFTKYKKPAMKNIVCCHSHSSDDDDSPPFSASYGSSPDPNSCSFGFDDHTFDGVDLIEDPRIYSDDDSAKVYANSWVGYGESSSSELRTAVMTTDDKMRLPSGNSPAREAADFFFGASDDKLAFQYYYRELLEARRKSRVSCDTNQEILTLAICCARSIHSGVSTDDAQVVIKTLRPPASPCSSERVAASFLMPAAVIYVLAHTGNTEKARRLARTLMDRTINGANPLHLSSRCPRFDLIAYQFLSYCLSLCNETHLDTITILGKFASQKTVATQSHPSSCVRRCLDWCLDELGNHPTVPMPLHAIVASTANQHQWADDLQLYGSLWQNTTAGTTSSPWASTVQTELGISPAELLATLSWLIMEHAPPARDHSGTSNTAQRLMHRALSGAQALRGLDDEELWRALLDKFTRMNDLVALNPEDRAFKAEALQHIRRYVKSVLDV